MTSKQANKKRLNLVLPASLHNRITACVEAIQSQGVERPFGSPLTKTSRHMIAVSLLDAGCEALEQRLGLQNSSPETVKKTEIIEGESE